MPMPPLFMNLIFIISGTIMVIFNKVLGKNFSKIGKSIWKNAPNLHRELMPNFINIYDEKNTSKAMLVIGITSIVIGGYFSYIIVDNKINFT